MAAVDRYPAALLELMSLSRDANDIARAAYGLGGRVGRLIEDLRLLPNLEEDEAWDAYWGPLNEELDRREAGEGA